MSESLKYISREQGQEILDRLRNDPKYWGEFIMRPDVQAILKKALASRNLTEEVTITDFVSAIFIYYDSKKEWFRENIENPGALYGYFCTAVRRLLSNRTFMRNLIGYDPLVEGKSDSMDAKDGEHRSIEETLSYEDNENSGEIAERKIECFKEIISVVMDRSPKFGEILYRTYLHGEKAESIARDFLRRGLISAKDVDSAVKNVQNSLLPRARDRFNAVALEKKYDLMLEGKVKKSEIKKIKR